MSTPRIEHVNVTVSNPERAARLMEELFGWQVRWKGSARNGATRSTSGRRSTISRSIPGVTSPTPRTTSPRAGR